MLPLSIFRAAVHAYITCALWSSPDEPADPDAEPSGNLDDWATADDLAPSARAQARADLVDFLRAVGPDDLHAYLTAMGPSPQMAIKSFGHDFWLTRNHHGAGFWDRGLGDLGHRLTQHAKACGSADLYVGDDGRIYSA